MAAEPFLDPDVRLLLPPRHRWHPQYLEYLGFPKDRITPASVGTSEIEELYYVPFLNSEQILPDLNMFSRLTERLRKGSSKPGRRNGPSIFISRQDAPDRRLLNEEALCRIAESVLGPIRLVRLSAMSLQEQIDALNDAPFIIGAQGQGMHMAIFTTGKTVIILEPNRRPQQSYQGWPAVFRTMAELAGNRALRLFSEITANRTSDWSYPENKFRQDLERLKQITGSGAR